MNIHLYLLGDSQNENLRRNSEHYLPLRGQTCAENEQKQGQGKT